MDEREFLKKIRGLKDRGEKISLTESPSSKPLIKEDIIDLDNKSNIQNLDPDEQREEENKFKDTVSNMVKFNRVKVYKENVEWSGYLLREKIEWVYSLDDTVGCYITTSETIQLKDEVLETLKKLKAYYDIWSEEWSGRLTGVSSTEFDMDNEG
jgi:hypothetical protein